MAPKVAAKTAAKPAAKPGAKAKAPSAAAPKKAAAGTKAKAGPAGAKKGAAGKKPAAKKPQWTPEQVAAGTKIQAQIRGFLGRKHYRENKEKKKMMDEELEKLRQQAFLAEVQYERRQEEKKRKKRAEEAARKKKETKLKKDMLEAAFDGEDAEMKKLMAEAEDVMDNVVDVADGHGNTLLSEAAAGGAATTVKYLLKMGANPNTQGEFKRTPLWRAAFLGKADCIAPLLEGGADPRIGNESGELPHHVGNPAIKEVIQAWDTSATDSLVAQFEAMQLEREAQKVAKKRKEINDAQSDMDAAVEAHEKAQKDLKKARQELERLIYEYDTLVGECKPQTIIEVAKGAIKGQEAKLESATQTSRDASERLQNARLAFREMKTGEEGEEDLPGQLINLKDLDDVLVKDVGDRILSTGKWPAIIDVSSQASVFLRYMDSNYVNCLNMNQIEPNKLRRSVLGSIRYGKPCVIDIMVRMTMLIALYMKCCCMLSIQLSLEHASYASYDDDQGTASGYCLMSAHILYVVCVAFIFADRRIVIGICAVADAISRIYIYHHHRVYISYISSHDMICCPAQCPIAIPDDENPKGFHAAVYTTSRMTV